MTNSPPYHHQPYLLPTPTPQPNPPTPLQIWMEAHPPTQIPLAPQPPLVTHRKTDAPSIHSPLPASSHRTLPSTLTHFLFPADASTARPGYMLSKRPSTHTSSMPFTTWRQTPGKPYVLSSHLSLPNPALNLWNRTNSPTKRLMTLTKWPLTTTYLTSPALSATSMTYAPDASNWTSLKQRRPT
jgi:hypothetical protein